MKLLLDYKQLIFEEYEVIIEPITVGSLVILNSGSPTLIVRSLIDDEQSAWVDWEMDGNIWSQLFPTICLTKIKLINLLNLILKSAKKMDTML